MTSRFTGLRAIPYVFWFLALSAILIWSLVPGYVVGWDLHVYENAIRALRLGHDPYVDGIAVQRAFHETLAQHPTASTPFTYVYSPLTLPLVKLISLLPLTVSGTVYWILYWIGLFTAIWVGMQAVETKELYVFALIAPAAVFFPGLLQNDVLFSGNVAYLLYGLVFAAAWVGWRRGNWTLFYVVVLGASCCKAPLLTLLVIPVLSARNQWLPAIATAVAGLGAFAIQPYVWPTLFRNYLTAVELQFSYNHDFGSSPAGLVADTLYDSIPYSVTSAVFYLVYAIPAFLMLLYLSRKFLAGRFPVERWMPLVSVGAILLNPRIMEYDVAPVTVSMALLLWRFFAQSKSLRLTIAGAVVYFFAMNGFAAHTWRPTESIAIVSVFAGGCWTLYRELREDDRRLGGVLAAEHA